MSNGRFATVLFVILSTAMCAAAQSSQAVVAVPRIDAIAIDGDASDWSATAFNIDVMADASGTPPPTSNFRPRIRLGWDAQGLLVFVDVADNELCVRDDPGRLGDGDCFDLWLVRGDGGITQISVGPGPHGAIVASRDVASGKAHGVAPTASARRQPGGYAVELRLPLADQGHTARLKHQIRLQLSVTDVDDTTRNRYRAVWYPAEPSPAAVSKMRTLQLAKKPSPPEQVLARGRYTQRGKSAIVLWGVPNLAGRTIAVRNGRDSIGSIDLVASGEWSSGSIEFPMPELDAAYPPLRLSSDRDVRGWCIMPDAERFRAGHLLMAQIAPSLAAFTGESFPQFDFDDPLLIERILGPYSITTQFYNADMTPVTSAKSPGRYGAVVDVAFASGRKARRFQTVYRGKAGYDGLQWWATRPEMEVQFPPQLGLNLDVIDEHAVALGSYFRDASLYHMQQDWKTGALLAGMNEMQPLGHPAEPYEDAFARDRQWWVTLKRRLYGSDAEYAAPFVCPRPKDGPPATVLREGSTAEAGMKPETKAALDALCTEWAEKSGEPFAACVARRGVVFFHKAYGVRNGEPMTVTTRSWMASISKLLGGTLMMTVVDQGLVDLDEDIAKYLPRLRKIEVERPLHIRDLFTHTNGLALSLPSPRNVINHWGDDLHDLEEQIAEYYPQLEVAKAHGYNGVGYAIGGKIVEAVTGEAVPQAFRNHLYGPLGCDNTDAIDMSARTMSVPMDMAKIGQLLLNKGAYGSMRFFSEETFEKMMPTRLRQTTGTPTDAMWGIGVVNMQPNGLSTKTFGHGAASSATLVIDPENELVITMTRNTAGPHFGEYHGKFIKTIAEGLQK